MSPRPDIHALLIGIDAYPRVANARAPMVSSLWGSVRDVLAMQALLASRFQVGEACIERLTARHDASPESDGQPDTLPSLPNVLAALERLDARARPGDEILIHFSGHGARVPTRLRERKGSGGTDECLVLHGSSKRTIALFPDNAIAGWIERLAQHDRGVFLLLDCCHAGGASRLPYRRLPIARAVSAEEIARLPSDAIEVHRSQWRSRRVESTLRWFERKRFGQELPPGATALAACRPQELAFEDALGDAGAAHGALTFYFLEALREGGANLDYESVFGRVLARVRSRFPAQFPMVEGNRSRLVLGREWLRGTPLIQVLAGEEERAGEVVLDVGEIHGLCAGALLRVHGVSDPFGVPPLALAEVVEVKGVSCRARITESRSPVSAGDRAELLDPSTWKPQTRARRPMADREAPSGWRDRSMDEPLSQNLSLAPLERRSRAQALRDLENLDPASRLAGKIGLELHRVPAGCKSEHPRELLPLEHDGSTVIVRAPETTFLSIENTSRLDLNLVVLNIDEGGSIAQIFPAPELRSSEPLSAGGKIGALQECFLESGVSESIEVLKVIATTGPLNSRFLSSPPIDRDSPATLRSAKPASTLDQLLFSLSAAKAATRSAGHATLRDEDWTTAQLVVRVVARESKLG